MQATQILERLIVSHRRDYDVFPHAQVNGVTYDAYARFNVTSARYVLIKKAEIYRARSVEHTFMKMTDTLSEDDVDAFHSQAVNYFEPVLVRGGEPYPEKDHHYSFITGLFISEKAVSPEVRTYAERYKYEKNYLFTIRGYCECRLLVFDAEREEVFGNRAAKPLIKGYGKSQIFSEQ